MLNKLKIIAKRLFLEKKQPLCFKMSSFQYSCNQINDYNFIFYAKRAPAIVAVIMQAKVAANNACMPSFDKFPC
ncbi:hypothetical protein Belba_2453 [Belliella baltica DSM 15883]|uniref:Uncharacterized protein n=1 Tax=Belliella baltica (strain DSM 15883 / CIP 108006 / LMG 21964 / BA134) TaxID=866536 RepID=I3Z6Z3_BELBD|nr:hypothetical protein Belba_2453 [Belliella baltica DSM 15883]